jgi:hypothetical protein
MNTSYNHWDTPDQILFLLYPMLYIFINVETLL